MLHLKRFLDVWPRIASTRAQPPQSVDLRYANGFAVRWPQPLVFAEYREQVVQSAERGYAIDDGFSHSGICSLSVAIPASGNLRLCLSVSTFAGTRTPEELDRLGHKLVELAHLPVFRD